MMCDRTETNKEQMKIFRTKLDKNAALTEIAVKALRRLELEPLRRGDEISRAIAEKVRTCRYCVAMLFLFADRTKKNCVLL